MFMGMNYAMQNRHTVCFGFLPNEKLQFSLKIFFFHHYIIEFTTLILRNTM